MKEWSDKYNSFNSLKGLMYIREYEGILKDKLLPPVEASIAPIGSCNFNCIWCNSQIILKRKPQMIDKDKMKNLLLNWLDWGIKGYCWAGTGEPTLYPYLSEMLYLVKEKGGENAILSNGSKIKKEVLKSLGETCRWIGISMDAATPKTYSYVKGVSSNKFSEFLDNVSQLVKFNKIADISLKFLIHSDNYKEIYKACKIAKNLGVYDFHIRPACTVGFLGVKEKNFNSKQIDLINKQILKCFRKENENFRVFGVKHKFSPTFKVANNFKKCLASPLLLIAESDGYAYICLEHRGKKKYRLGRLEDVRKFWGSKEHLKKLKNINPKRECQARCTLTAYNEQIENCVLKDKMCRNFP